MGPAASPTRITRLYFRRIFFAVAALLALAVQSSAQTATFPLRDQQLLLEIEERGLRFFIDHTHPTSGLTRDRAPALGTAGYAPASVAASGFALSAWVIASERGWMSRDEVLQRSLRTLRFMRDHVAHERGWMYHFVDYETGHRVWNCEASTIDTALFLKGAITVREYLQDPEVTNLVNTLYRRMDWNWARNGQLTLTHGWTPEKGFIVSRWDSYSELMGLYLLGLAAPENGLPAESWHSWARGPIIEYKGYKYIACPPLFTHQFSHAWFNFRGQSDDHADYFENSVSATLAQREWCASLQDIYPFWSHNMWGLTASDSATGYRAWGGPQNPSAAQLDGTLVPCAVGGSIPFAPRETLEALQAMRRLDLDNLWGRYGFADAFNIGTGWVAEDVIAIDVGITMIMAENAMSGAIWGYFMRAPEAKRGMAIAGFKPNTTLDQKVRPVALHRAEFTPAH